MECENEELESNNETIKRDEKPKRSLSVDSFVSGMGKIFSMGEVPNDPIVKVLKRFFSWLKYILLIEIVGGFVAFMPYYSFTLIKEGRTDDLAEFLVKSTELLHNEGAEEMPPEITEPKKNAICTNCGGGNTELLGSDGKFSEWWCDDCKMNFTIEDTE